MRGAGEYTAVTARALPQAFSNGVLELECCPHGEALVCDALASLTESFLKHTHPDSEDPDMPLEEVVTNVVMGGYASSAITDVGSREVGVEIRTRAYQLSS
jgi:hypothetical protein